jgi:tetratricopeptide (TPR) repeat protein
MTAERFGLLPVFSCCFAGSAAWLVALASVSLWLLSACAAGSSPYPQCHVLVTAEDHFHCGYAAYDHQDYRTAIREFSAAIAQQPGYKYALNQRGLAYKYDGQYEAAIADFDTIIRLYPNAAAGAYLNRANIRRRQGDDEAALLEYAEALRIEPTFANAYCNRAVLLHDIGDLAGALRDFDDGIRFYKEAADGPNPRMHAWYSDGGYGDRVSPDSRLRQIDSYLARCYFNRGTVYRARGDDNHAESDFAAARNIDPSIDNKFTGVLN